MTNRSHQLPRFAQTDPPAVTVAQMRLVDELMVEKIGVDIIMMMENASVNTARLSQLLLGGEVGGKRVVVLAGKGNNGGDGLGAARHLINFGAKVEVVLADDRQELVKNATIQQRVLDALQVPTHQAAQLNDSQLAELLAPADLVIDALLGYNLHGDPRDEYARLITAANNADRPTLAIDIPSGLDADLGQPHSPCIKADWTLTLALPKVGLQIKTARQYVGELYVCDLSVPDWVYRQLGIETRQIFAHSPIVQVT